MLEIKLNELMNVYLSENSRTTNVGSRSHQLLVVEIPMLIKSFLNRNDLVIKGSEGTGNRTSYPWITIMNKKLTNTPQKSVYLAILFKRDMSGFYSTLNQGITFFEKQYKRKKYEAAEKVAEYFKSEIKDDSFSKQKISLGGVRGDNGYGFEKTTILSRYFQKETFDEKLLLETLNNLIKFYDEVIELLYPFSYEQAVMNILQTESSVKLAIDEAEKLISETLHDVNFQKPDLQSLVEVQPNRNKVKRLRKLSIGSDKKTDFIKMAEENAKTGLRGEELVLEWEKERLLKFGFDQLVEQIKWVSQQTDVLGYDIESFTVDHKGVPQRIYIEVKTTKSKYDTDFFVSSNEVKKSEIYGKNYWIYRVFDCDSETPKLYMLNGKIEDNFNIDPITFVATLKSN